MRISTGLVVGLICGLIGSMAQAAEQGPRTLSFEDRVNAQRAIERVYYGHQLGATKPFDEAVRTAVIEGKVRKYLDQTAALSVYWKTAVTDQTLQRELVRMAQGTKMPERLLELYAALGNDPFLIKECLARPALVDRLTHNFYAFDATLHAKAQAQAEAIHGQLVSGALSPSAEHPNRTVSEIMVGETETSPAPTEPPSQRRLTASEFKIQRAALPARPGEVSEIQETREAFVFDVVLSETKKSVRVASYVVAKTAWDAWWEAARRTVRGDAVTAVASGREDFPTPQHRGSVGSRATCSDDGWDNGSLDDLPEARLGHATVWTGSVMVVWSGMRRQGSYMNTGGRYDPATDSWTMMTTIGAPVERPDATAVWTGTVVVVWGGGLEHGFNTGGRYDPNLDSWMPTSTVGAPSARLGHTAVWTGSEMVVWGGHTGYAENNPAAFNTGGRYNPATNTWRPTSTAGAPSAGDRYGAVWTGELMLVWGSRHGGRYDPLIDRWTPLSNYGAPESISGHSVVWTGSAMVVWGGTIAVHCDCPGGPGYELELVNTGARYDPLTDTWTPTSIVGAPTPRNDHHAVWAGHVMVIWNDLASQSSFAGGRYDPATDSWTSMSSTGAPKEAEGRSVVWTGNLMVVWGGRRGTSFSSPPLNTGGRYDPVADSWTPTSLTNAPSTRYTHSAVWTGNLMVVWGGYFSELSTYYYLDSGGRYDPVIDDWTPTSTIGAPPARSRHAAVWNGDLMVVWGGLSDVRLDTGGRYDPVADAWTPTSTTGAPSPRYGQTAVWTGTQMAVWGGMSDDGFVNTGALYDPFLDSWTPISTTGAPSARYQHTAVWTGQLMVVWGGYFYDGSNPPAYPTTGGKYDPATDSWTPTSTTGAPVGRVDHSAVLVANQMIVWGGRGPSSSYPINTGGRYDPAIDTWTPTSMVGVPVQRYRHAAVSTGALMVVWGGTVYNSNYFANISAGGWYDPVMDRWTKMSTVDQPPAAPDPAVWTGNAMIVWSSGGGGRYSLGSSLDTDCDGDGVSASAGDCDDHNASVYPGAPQLCDGIANDCLSPTWPDAFTEDDFDQDGFRICQGDCDDRNETVYPGASQLCDGINNDCNDPAPPYESDNDHDGFRTCQGDCDDTDRYVYPGAREYCDGRDQDCDDEIDEGGDALCRTSNVCRTGVCHGLEGCSYYDNTAACDDNNACTSGDVCANGYCHGAPLEGTACDDHNICTANDVCGNYYCYGTPTVGTACSDNDPCTTDDSCENGQCLGGAPFDCNDGDACNGSEYCREYYGCFPGTPVTCDDDNYCTDDSCDPAIGCVFTANANACDDGNTCTAEDACVDGLCRGTPHPGDACDDDDVCTINDTCGADGICNGGAPRNCDDGNACNGAEICYYHYGCYSSGPLYCFDGNPCTSDGCSPTTGCVFTNTTAPCNDGDACTSGDTCGDGACHGTAVVCNDNNACTTDSCDSFFGCVFSNDTISCDDDNPCTDDACDPATGLCAHPMDDTNACSDGDACTQTDECHAGVCTGSNPVECGGACPPGFTAVGAFCQKTYDISASLLDNQAALCDGTGVDRYNDCNGLNYGFHWTDLGGSLSGVTRVDVQFEAGLTCSSLPSNVTLNGTPLGSFVPPGNCYCPAAHATVSFSGVDVDAYVMAGLNSISIDPGEDCDGFSKSHNLGDNFARVTVTYAPRDATCQVGQCDPGTGACFVSNLPDGSECDDHDPCTGGDSCSAGACGGTALSCDDSNPCTDDSCDPATGCAHVNNTATCDDGSACTTGDVCGDGTCNAGIPLVCNDGNLCNGIERCEPTIGCVAGAPISCNDDNPCTDDSCDPTAGCVFTNNAIPCDDGNACTAGDTCRGGACGNGLPIACDDRNACTADTCNPLAGCVFTNNAISCEDGNACTVGDACAGGACVGGAPLACIDGNGCTTDTCNPATGCVFTNNTNPCDDGNACTRIDVCSAGACVGSNPMVCVSLDQCHDAGTCNPSTGNCANPAKPNGTICDDASLCTTGETCQSGTCTPAISGLNHPAPKSAGYYKKLCQQREHNPSHYQGDELTDADAVCVGQLTSTFAGMATIDELCEVVNSDHRPPHGGRHHGGSGDGGNGKDCDKGEDELIATALNICRARVCEEQNLDSSCHGNAHTTVSQSFADADAILDDAGRTKDSCKDARCELREINNGHALEMNSLALARENGKVRLTWSSPVLDDGSGAPNGYELWRRPMGSNDAFVRIGTTSGLTFLDATAGTAAWEYDITAVIPGN